MSEISGYKAPVPYWPYNENLGAYCGQEGERRRGGGRGAVWVRAGKMNNKCNIYSQTDGGEV